MPTNFLSTLRFCFFAFVAGQSLGAVINVKNAPYNAKGDGVSDDTVAIQNALNAAQLDGSEVLIPAGTYRYSNNLRMTGIKVSGEGIGVTILSATDFTKTAFFVQGASPTFSNLEIRVSPKPTVRSQAQEATGVAIYNATNFSVTNVKVSEVACVGILVNKSFGTASAYAQLKNCQVVASLADAFHVTNTSSYIEVSYNTATNPGDDMFAVVSYLKDGGLCTNIKVHHNIGNQQTWGRGTSVVGGRDIEIYNNQISYSSASGLYIGSELSYNTYGSDNVYAHDNVYDHCPNNNLSGHHGINVFGRVDPAGGAGTDFYTKNITVLGNTVTNSPTAGINVGSYTQNLVFQSNIVQNSAASGILIQPNARLVGLFSNQIDGSNQSGLVGNRGYTDVYIGDIGRGNTISRSVGYNIYIDPSNATGMLYIRDNDMVDANQTSLGYIDALNVASTASAAAIVILDNTYTSTSGLQNIERFIEANTPVVELARNTTDLTGAKTLFTLSGTPGAAVFGASPSGSTLGPAIAPISYSQPPINVSVSVSITP